MSDKEEEAYSSPASILLNTGKAERRGTGTTSGSAYSSAQQLGEPTSGTAEGQQQQQQQQPQQQHCKARRRVSFTPATAFGADETNPDDVFCGYGDANNNVGTSPKPVRRSSLDLHNLSLEATPHHSNATTSQQNSSPYYDPQQLYNSPSPSSSFRSPSRRGSGSNQNRRTSLDSASSFSSATSGTIFSAGSNNSSAAPSLASQLSFKDEPTRRAKVMECLLWLSRHLADALVLDLIQDIRQQQQQQQQSAATSSDDNESSRVSATATSDTISRARSFRRSSTGTSTSQHPNNGQHTKKRSSRDAKHKRRRSSSYFHCEVPVDKDTTATMNDRSEKSQHSRRQQRLEKTRESLDRLSSTNGDICSEQQDDMVVLGYESTSSVSSWGDVDDDEDEGDVGENAGMISGTLLYRAPLLDHQSMELSAVLMIDISGFTKLSTTLPLQALSKTINTYFQCIVQCIHEYGGDVVKFAGDCVFATWKSKSKGIEDTAETSDGADAVAKELFVDPDNAAVQTATACACQIIETCSDYHVYKHQHQRHHGKDDNDNKNKEVLATLNVHCGIGFSTILGFHAGDNNKREYLLLGDAIPQAGDAIAAGRGGEVVASPQVYQMLTSNTTTALSQYMEATEPQVIYSSRQDKYETTPNLLDPTMLRRRPNAATANKRPSLAEMLQDWDYTALVKLQKRMSLYVHPAVVDGELFTTIYHNRGSLSSFGSESQGSSSQAHHDQQMLQSEAEIRQVFTLFLQPLINVSIASGDPAQDEETLAVLNQIMVLANRELMRFKGHFRQFIVDDKGVLLIFNFGLRGSVFPQMIEEHAMPFAASLQSVLQAEISVECRMGATFGKAYCGVIGGLCRHEYSILGPSVNLAARLMCHPQNEGFLVDEATRQEAENWDFEALQPVMAKGYADPVHIFEPLVHNRSPWKRATGIMVGREEELDAIVELADDFVDSGGTESKLVLISAATGFGKSLVMSEAVNRIRQKCVAASHSHLILGQVCCEEDLFHPLSVIGPIVLDTLARTKSNVLTTRMPDKDSSTPAIEIVHSPTSDAEKCGSESITRSDHFYSACERAEIPKENIETLYSLVFNHQWPTPSDDGDCSGDLDDQTNYFPSSSRLEEMAKLVVSMFLQATVDFDLVMVGVDDMSLMDELSWKVIQLVFDHACNVMVIGTSRPTTCKDIHIDPKFWAYLFEEAKWNGRFAHIELLPLRESDVRRLIIHHLAQQTTGTEDEKKTCTDLVEEQFSHEVYLQSGGNPRLVAGMVEKYASRALDDDNDDDGNQDGYKGYNELYKCIKEQSTKKASGVDLDISEHLLHRLDSLPAIVRTHLNLGALLGASFYVNDAIRVMEKYRGVSEEEKQEHVEFVHDSLNEAVWHGILEVEEELVATSGDASTQNTKYRFTHSLWRNHIVNLTLDDWQRDMQDLISATVVFREEA